jgi:hypothetical protein
MKHKISRTCVWTIKHYATSLLPGKKKCQNSEMSVHFEFFLVV